MHSKTFVSKKRSSSPRAAIPLPPTARKPHHQAPQSVPPVSPQEGVTQLRQSGTKITHHVRSLPTSGQRATTSVFWTVQIVWQTLALPMGRMDQAPLLRSSELPVIQNLPMAVQSNFPATVCRLQRQLKIK